MPKHKIIIRPGDRVIEAIPGMSLLDAIHSMPELDIDASCMGKGTCGKCLVRVISGSLSHPSFEELELLAGEKETAGEVGIRLACAAKIQGDCEIGLIAPQGAGVSVNVESRLNLAQFPGFAARTDIPGKYGLSLDVGTTTLVGSLVDFSNFSEIARGVCVNPQRAFGADVIARISHASTGAEGLKQLQSSVIKGINKLIIALSEAVGIPHVDIAEICAAGNPAMLHILAGVDPSSIGVHPYTPVFKEAQDFDAGGLGLHISPGARVKTLPFPSAFVGADITAGLVSIGLESQGGNHLFLDIGTNGEMVLGMGKSLVASSCAAGPALEGMGLACGSTASPGAVESVSVVKDDISVATIGGAVPKGICGSGAVDAIAAMLEAGVVDESGRMVSREEDSQRSLSGKVSARLTEISENKGFLLSGREDSRAAVYITQEDVRHVQLAKAAISSGIKIMLSEAGLTLDSLDSIIIAGEFGAHLNPKSLARLGVIPKEAVDGKVRFVGNTSLMGAFLCLCSKQAMSEAIKLVSGINTIELASNPDYQEIFVDELSFPVE